MGRCYVSAFPRFLQPRFGGAFSSRGEAARVVLGPESMQPE